MNFLREYPGRGPRTPDGIQRVVRANTKHGRRSAQARREQVALRAFLRSCRKTIAKVHGIETLEFAPKAARGKASTATNSEDCPKLRERRHE